MAQFSDTSNHSGIVQSYEREIGATLGDISGSTTKLKLFTADANSALADFNALAIRTSGRAQFDDSNHTDYAIITVNLVANQRDYALTLDENGNYIGDIHKVLVANSAGTFSQIDPVDVQGTDETSAFWSGANTTGTPTRYDKTGNAIFLDPIPSYSLSGGLKIYISRSPSYFAYTDTTKKPGIPYQFHDYIFLKPALAHARRNQRPNYQTLSIAVAQMERDVEEYFSSRNRDEHKRLQAAGHDNR